MSAQTNTFWMLYTYIFYYNIILLKKSVYSLYFCEVLLIAITKHAADKSTETNKNVKFILFYLCTWSEQCKNNATIIRDQLQEWYWQMWPAFHWHWKRIDS